MWWLTELKHNSFCVSGDKNREIFSQEHLLPLCDVWESEQWKQNLNWKIKLTTSKDLFTFLGDFDVSSLDYFSLCPDFQFQLPVSVLAWRGALERRRVGGSEGRRGDDVWFAYLHTNEQTSDAVTEFWHEHRAAMISPFEVWFSQLLFFHTEPAGLKITLNWWNSGLVFCRIKIWC